MKRVEMRLIELIQKMSLVFTYIEETSSQK